MGKNAIITLATTEGYAMGALVLGRSLRGVGTTADLICMVTRHVAENTKNILGSVFDRIEIVDVLDSNDAAMLALLKRPELGVTLTKLHCWKYTEYSKMIFMDSDCLVLQSIDELFTRPEISAVADCGWPSCFNSGVFVFSPSLETFSKLIEFAKTSGSWDGGDQGLLNAYFSDWSTKNIENVLPFGYNVHAAATYAYIPAFEQFKNDVKVIHFLGENKPWTSQNSPSEQFKDFWGQWWSYFNQSQNVVPESVQGEVYGIKSQQSYNSRNGSAPAHNTSFDQIKAHLDSQLEASEEAPVEFDIKMAVKEQEPFNASIQEEPRTENNLENQFDNQLGTDTVEAIEKMVENVIEEIIKPVICDTSISLIEIPTEEIVTNEILPRDRSDTEIINEIIQVAIEEIHSPYKSDILLNLIPVEKVQKVEHENNTTENITAEITVGKEDEKFVIIEDQPKKTEKIYKIEKNSDDKIETENIHKVENVENTAEISQENETHSEMSKKIEIFAKDENLEILDEENDEITTQEFKDEAISIIEKVFNTAQEIVIESETQEQNLEDANDEVEEKVIETSVEDCEIRENRAQSYLVVDSQNADQFDLGSSIDTSALINTIAEKPIDKTEEKSPEVRPRSHTELAHEIIQNAVNSIDVEHKAISNVIPEQENKESQELINDEKNKCEILFNIQPQSASTSIKELKNLESKIKNKEEIEEPKAEKIQNLHYPLLFGVLGAIVSIVVFYFTNTQ